MTKDNQKTNRGQPPKINLNGTENGAPAKTPPPARPFIPFNMNADLDATKKQTARIDLSSVTSIPKGVAPHDEDEAAKKSTVRVQIDEDHVKGDTARLDTKSSVGAEESAKKRTARIDLNEVLDESDDIFKRRTALMDAGKLAGVTEAPGVPRTVRIKRPETPLTNSLRQPAPVAEEEATVAATVMERETSRKSETARIDLPLEATEQPPTRRKTIRIKRPEGMVTSRPLIIGSAKSVAGGPTAIPKEEEAGALFSVMALVAILVGIALITVQSLTLRSFLQY